MNVRVQIARTIPYLLDEEATVITTIEMRNMISNYIRDNSTTINKFCADIGFPCNQLFREYLDKGTLVDHETEVDLVTKALVYIHSNNKSDSKACYKGHSFEQHAVPLAPDFEILDTLVAIANTAKHINLTNTEVWDNDDTVRMKLKRVKQLYDIKYKDFTPIIGVNSKSGHLSEFLQDKVDAVGPIGKVYFNSFLFFERLRVAINAPKSRKRLQREQRYKNNEPVFTDNEEELEVNMKSKASAMVIADDNQRRTRRGSTF